MPAKAPPQSRRRPLSAALAFWQEVCQRGGLNRRRRNGEAGFDGGFEAAVHGALGLPEGKPIGQALKSANIELESLVGAVLTAAAPWSAMMREVLEMLEQSGSSHSGDSVALRLKKTNIDAKLALTLDAFRRQTAKAERVVALSPDRRWGEVSWSDLRTVEGLSNIPPFHRGFRALSGPPIARWAEAFMLQRQSHGDAPLTPPPPPQPTGVVAYDEARGMAHAWLESALSVARSIGHTSEDRLKALQSRDRVFPAGWSSNDLLALELDYLGHTLLAQLETGAERLAPDALDRAGRRLRATLSAASRGQPVETLREQLLDILDLPLWKRRHDLYSVWIGARIARLADDPREWILTNGALDFSFGASALARFTPEHRFAPRGEIVLWSELKQPIDNPTGKSRKKHVQPDYSVVAHPTDSRPVGLVVECKQYWKPSAGNFRAALIDYARAHASASVLLASYGRTPTSIAADLGLDQADQIVDAFGDVRPFGAGMQSFEAAVRKGLQATGMLAKHVRMESEASRTTDDAEKDARRQQTFRNQTAEAVVRLSWATGGDLDLRAIPSPGSGWSTVKFDDKGHLDWPPYVALDRDDQNAPGCETIKIARLDEDWRIEVHRYGGDWPAEPVRVEVRMHGETTIYERPLAGSDASVWPVCTVGCGARTPVPSD